MIQKLEILAPAGSSESLLAAVRCGADAVYLGGKSLNARRGAANFGGAALEDAVKYCHSRNVLVYLTLNTVIFDSETAELEAAVKEACRLGVDAVIVQDLAVAAFVKKHAPSLALHASTQMSVHTPEGAKQLESLGFSRVVLARELSAQEIAGISKAAPISLECFVHGALCFCVSGQCYFSAMLGGRSGNRGLCAQPCRLPMNAGGGEYGLSLKDLSLVEKIPGLVKAGVRSLKIEGRMKRPEYVAAAVTACKRAIDDLAPDMDTLARVFSRDGFTSGYFDGKPGFAMFGSRRREDVTAASPALLSKLAAEYKNEARSIPVSFDLKLEEGKPASLTVSDGDTSVAVLGDVPQKAENSPLTTERASSYLSKTGGTPFFPESITAGIGDMLTLPASALNAMRREALDKLLELRGQLKPHEYIEDTPPEFSSAASKPAQPPSGSRRGEIAARHCEAYSPAMRVRVFRAQQLTPALAKAAELITIPVRELGKLDADMLKANAAKLCAQLPRVIFGHEQALRSALELARENGITHAEAGNIGSIKTAGDMGFKVHGGFSLNITNTSALTEYERLGLIDAAASVELSSRRISALGGALPRGILAYGYLPLMIARNCPVNKCKNCKAPVVTDRLNNKFPVICDGFGAAEILNCVPLYLADRMGEFSNLDYYTLYFTIETPRQCEEILAAYQQGLETDTPKTRGLYFREVK